MEINNISTNYVQPITLNTPIKSVNKIEMDVNEKKDENIFDKYIELAKDKPNETSTVSDSTTSVEVDLTERTNEYIYKTIVDNNVLTQFPTNEIMKLREYLRDQENKEQ